MESLRKSGSFEAGILANHAMWFLIVLGGEYSEGELGVGVRVGSKSSSCQLAKLARLWNYLDSLDS